MSVKIRGNCFACGMCVEECPTGAIDYAHKDKNGGYTGIVVDDEKCVNCHACVEVCASGCLKVEKDN